MYKEIQGSKSPGRFPAEPICHILKEAGRILCSGEGMLSDRRAKQKEGCGNYVTEYDIRIQRFIKDRIKELFPSAAFFAEESDGEMCGTGPITVYLDPIDGTNNFLHGCRDSAISLAVFESGEPVFGAVYLPFTDELFQAEKDGGAFLNGRSIHVSGRKTVDAITIAGTASYYKETLGKISMALASKLFLRTADLRRYGSAAMEMCFVACGRAELSFEMKLFPWDYAAGALIVTEAGGIVSDLSGNALSFDRAGSMLCSNREVYTDVLKLCGKCLDGQICYQRKEPQNERKQR